MECAVLDKEHFLVQVSLETFSEESHNSEVATRNSEVVPSRGFNQLDFLGGEPGELEVEVVSRPIQPTLRFRPLHLLP